MFTLLVALGVLALLTVVDVPSHTPAAAIAEEATARPSAPVPVAPLFHSRWYTQTVDPELAVGDTAVITVVLRNVGHTAWVRDTAAEVRLGERERQPLPEAMRVNWLAGDRPAAQSEATVGEWGLATFTFEVRGATRGIFRLELRPVVDGVTWLEDDGIHVDIWVR